MLSRGIARHVPPVPKGYNLTDSIYCLFAGGVSLSAGIIHAAQAALYRKYAALGKECSVQQAAFAFQESYQGARIALGAKEILPDFLIAGVDEYHERRPTLPRKTVNEIERRIKEWRLPDDEVPEFIVFGVDPSGSHIYRVTLTRIDCHDPFGFASIGSNCGPANQLLHDHQAWHQPFGAALMLSYAAAWSSVDLDYGVGAPLDVFFVGPEATDATLVDQLGMFQLSAVYDGTVRRGLGGLEMAVAMAQRLVPNASLGVTLPSPASDPPSAPPTQSGSTHDP